MFIEKQLSNDIFDPRGVAPSARHHGFSIHMQTLRVWKERTQRD